jgi:hypothetical protein
MIETNPPPQGPSHDVNSPNLRLTLVRTYP